MFQPSTRNHKRARSLTATGLVAGLALAPLLILGGSSAASATPTDPLRVCGVKGTNSRILTLQKIGSDTQERLAGATYQVSGLLYELGVGQSRWEENFFFEEYQATRAALDAFTPQRDAAAETRAAAATALRAAEYAEADAEAAVNASADLLVAEQRVTDAAAVLEAAEAALAAMDANDPGVSDTQAAVAVAQAELDSWVSERDAVLAPLQAAVNAASAVAADARAALNAAEQTEAQVKADSEQAANAWRDVMGKAWALGTQGIVTVTTGENGQATPVELVRGYKNTGGDCDDIPATVTEVSAPAGYQIDSRTFTEDVTTAFEEGGALQNSMVVVNDPIPATPAAPETPVQATATPLAHTGSDPRPFTLLAGLAAAGLALAGAGLFVRQASSGRRSS